MDIIKVILTAVLSIAAIFIITKLMGHKQVAQLDFFDYVSGITIGSIAAELATELESPWKPLLALVVYGAASLFLNFITSKLPKTRKYINGTPTTVMHNGKIIRENLKKTKLDLSEFLLLCREEGFFDLSEIEAAIFEYNGRLSVLPKSDHRPLTPADVNLNIKNAELQTELIMDGRIIGENLVRLRLDRAWLEEKIRAQGWESEKDILLATYQISEDKLTLYPMK